jgi:hypothetical protein
MAVVVASFEVSIKIHGVLAYLVYFNIKMFKHLHLSLIAFFFYEKLVYTMMENNSTNISKTINHR